MSKRQVNAARIVAASERCKNYDNVAAIITPQKLKRIGVQIEEEIVGVQTHVHRGLFLERDEKHDRDE